MTEAPSGTAAANPTATNPLTELLVRALQGLADAGELDHACRLAGHACAALRHDDPVAWRRFNALLHRLLARPR